MSSLDNMKSCARNDFIASNLSGTLHVHYDKMKALKVGLISLTWINSSERRCKENHFRLIHLCYWVQAEMKAAIFETCAISCLNCVCKSVTSVPTALGEIIGSLQDRSNKEVDGFWGGVLRNGSLSVWLKLSHKSWLPVWCQLVTIPWADEV